MSDPEYWSEADKFNPDRFINEQGKFRKDERLVPYGIGKLPRCTTYFANSHIFYDLTGKRSCPGELMARCELFITFARLMQKFSLNWKCMIKCLVEQKAKAKWSNEHTVWRHFTHPKHKLIKKFTNMWNNNVGLATLRKRTKLSWCTKQDDNAN